MFWVLLCGGEKEKKRRDEEVESNNKGRGFESPHGGRREGLVETCASRPSPGTEIGAARTSDEVHSHAQTHSPPKAGSLVVILKAHIAFSFLR